MDLFLDTRCARNQQRAANFNHSKEAISRVTAFAVFFQDMTLIFAGTGILKIDLFDCAGEPIHAIITLLSNSLLCKLRVSRGFILDFLSEWVRWLLRGWGWGGGGG